MKILLVIVALLVIVVIGVVIASSMRPEAFHIERSIVIDRPPARVYAFVSDLRNYIAWSPWQKLDPVAKQVIEGPPGTVGSTFIWDGNDKVGAGKMTIAAVRPDQQLDVKLEFFRPFASTSTTTWTTAPEGAGTKMTWAMDGRNEALPQKIFGMFMMESMLGKSFDEGLALLKTAVEKQQ